MRKLLSNFFYSIDFLCYLNLGGKGVGNFYWVWSNLLFIICLKFLYYVLLIEVREEFLGVRLLSLIIILNFVFFLDLFVFLLN